MKVSKKYLAKIIAEEVEKTLQENIVVDKADGTPLVWREIEQTGSNRGHKYYKETSKFGNFYVHVWRTILELSEETPPPAGGDKTPQIIVKYAFPDDEKAKQIFPKGAFGIAARIYTKDGKVNIVTGITKNKSWESAYNNFKSKVEEKGYKLAPVDKHNLSSSGGQRMPRPIAKLIRKLFGEKEQKPSPEKTTSQEPGADLKKTRADAESGMAEMETMLKKKFIRASRIQPRRSVFKSIPEKTVKDVNSLRNYLANSNIPQFKGLKTSGGYDRDLFNRIYKFQQEVFKNPKEHDGIVGGRTWAKIAYLVKFSARAAKVHDGVFKAKPEAEPKPEPKPELKPVERGSGVASKTVTKGNLTRPASK